MENTWYYKEDVPHSKLLMSNEGEIDESGCEKYKLTDEEVLEFREIINGLESGGHRCIRVYRDAIQVEGVVYNMCFSCEDIEINNKAYSFSGRGKGLMQLSKFRFKTE